MELFSFKTSTGGSDIWSYLIELTHQLELKPEPVIAEIEALGEHLLSFLDWLENAEWDTWAKQADRLIQCLEATLEGCVYVLDDGDCETACEIWSEARSHALDLNQDIEENPKSLLDLTG